MTSLEPAMVPPDDALRSALAALVRATGVELFHSLGLALRHDGTFDPRGPVWADPVSFVGFGGSSMAGALIVSAPWPLMATTSPSAERRPEVLADWSRELANLLLGGLKMSLVRRGLSVQIGLPTSVVSSDLRISTSARDPIGERFRLGDQCLLVALDCVVTSGWSLADELPGPWPSSGDALLF